jgi:translation initiation factor 2B subunit (eIF-2B alpha/beta/delta family)
MKPLEDVLKNEVQDELDSIKDILSKGGLSLYLIVECISTTFLNMTGDDERQLKELLRNIELFDPTLTPNASAVIDNVLKQIKLFLEPSSKPDESIRYLDDYKKNVLADILEKRPCHVFLWKIADMLEEKLKTSTNDKKCIEAIENTINEWEIKRREVLGKIPKIAYGILADGFPVLVYGYSYTIVKCIEHYLKEKKKDIEIYICEGRTKTEYRYNNRLAYCDGIRYTEELRKLEKKVNKEFENEGPKEKVRIKILYVTDSCASNLFSNHKVSKVLFGANGIGFNGRVSHTLGHLAIADMAAMYRIPVYIIADSMKIGYLQERSELQRGNQWLTTDIGFESKIADFENYNPREDVVPPDRIELIITEKGAIQPTEVRKYAENKR